MSIRLENHVTILSILHIGLSALVLLATSAVLLVMIGGGFDRIERIFKICRKRIVVKIGSEIFAGFPNHPFGITRDNGAPLIKIRLLPFMGSAS